MYLLFYRIAGAGGLFSGFDAEAWSGNWGETCLKRDAREAVGFDFHRGLLG